MCSSKVTEKIRPKTSYETFLESKEWKTFRDKNIGDKCAICPRRMQLQLHHYTYENGLLNDFSVVTLCKDCHKLVHQRHKDHPELGLDEITGLLMMGEMY